MARVRNLKPGFFSNEDLAECSPWARLCFAGLWTVADREGRLEDRPKRIKGQLFPMDAIDVEPLLGELVQHGFIVRYTINGLGFIQVIEFSKHQNPHHREPKSVIPSMQSPGLLIDKDDIKALGQPEASESIPVIPSMQSRAEPGTRNKEPKSLEQRAARKTAERFLDFWTVYPMKKGRANAEAQWRAKGYDAIADRIIADVKRRIIEDRQWLDGYAPHGSTYVNSQGWLDEIEPTKGANGGGNEFMRMAI
jgi:hypothetical protein